MTTECRRPRSSVVVAVAVAAVDAAPMTMQPSLERPAPPPAPTESSSSSTMMIPRRRASPGWTYPRYRARQTNEGVTTEPRPDPEQERPIAVGRQVRALVQHVRRCRHEEEGAQPEREFDAEVQRRGEVRHVQVEDLGQEGQRSPTSRHGQGGCPAALHSPPLRPGISPR